MVPKDKFGYQDSQIIEVNRKITDNTLNINASNIIALSSISIYGSDVCGVIDENISPNPQSAYAKSKLDMEQRVLRSSIKNRKILRIPGVFAQSRKNGLVYDLCRISSKHSNIILDNSAWTCIYLDDLVEIVSLILIKFYH